MTNGHLSYFWAPWCARCATVSPVVTFIAQTNNLALEVIDVEEMPEEARKRRVFGVPTVIASAPDGATYRRSGTITESDLQQLADFATGRGSGRPLLTSDEVLRLAAGGAVAAIGIVTDTVGLTILGSVLALSSFWHRLRRSPDPGS